jgi:hypothetical protein
MTKTTTIANLTATFDSDDNSVQLVDASNVEHGSGRLDVDGWLQGEFDLDADDFDALESWVRECVG